MAKRSLVRQTIEQHIFLVRGQKVLLDSDLAELYGVPVKALNQAVKRNSDRFPDDFLMRLTESEATALRSQFVTSNAKHGGRRYLPYAFTEHGAIMAAAVLKSQRAVEMSVFVVRAFIRLREVLATHKELAARVAELERKLQTHDVSIQNLLATIRGLTQVPTLYRKRIGFLPAGKDTPRQIRARTATAR
jgi:hypothetical protein